MTYCFFSAQYPPHLGGVESHTRRLAEKVVQNGGRALVVTSEYPGQPERETGETGVEIFRLPSWRLANGQMPVVKPGAHTRRLFAELASLPTDRIVVQTRLYPLSLAGVSFAKKRGIPAIVIEHGFAYNTAANGFINLGLGLYTAVLRRLVYRRCTHFYAVSQSSASWLKAHGIQPEGLFYNGISAEEVQAAKTAPARNYRAEFGIGEPALLLAYAGRLIPQKGILELAQAAERYNQTAPWPLYLLAAGEGELAGRLQSDEFPHLYFLGPLPFEEVIALYGQADMVCLPTGMPEGLPSALLEAGACGSFVLATRKGGVTEVVPSAEYGLLLEDNRPETLLAALQKAAADEAYRRAAAKKLHGRVMEQFTFDALYQTLENLPWEEDA